MRVALQYGSIHKCARVALVRITYDIFFFFLLVCGKLPFYAGRKSTAASSAKTCVFHGFNDIFRFHFGQNLAQGLITAVSDVFVNVFRINPTAVSKSNTHLLREEIKLIF